MVEVVVEVVVAEEVATDQEDHQDLVVEEQVHEELVKVEQVSSILVVVLVVLDHILHLKVLVAKVVMELLFLDILLRLTF